MKFGVKNYKVFENYQQFNIRPLTLLVGANNTGKSAFSKLLYLLKQGTYKLNFESQAGSRLDNFEDSINWKNPTKGFLFKFPAHNSFLPSMEVTATYENGICNSLEISAFEDDEIPVVEIRTTDNRCYLDFNYQWLLSCLFDGRLYYKNTLLNSDTSSINISEFRPLPSFSKENMVDSNILAIDDIFSAQKKTLFSIDKTSRKYSEHLGYVYDRKFYCILPFFSLRDDVLLKQQMFSPVLFEVYDNLVNVTDHYRNEIIEIQDNVFSNIELTLSDSFINSNKLVNDLKHTIKGQIKKIIRSNEITIKETDVFKMIFEERILKEDYSSYKSKLKYTLWEELLNQLYFLKESIQKVHFSNISRDISSDYISELYYAKENLNPERTKRINILLEEALKFFKLGNIEITKDEIFVAVQDNSKINDKNLDVSYSKKINVKNLGYGYSKIIPVILGLIKLSVTDVYSPYKDIFIIEEPEANLHPDFQSKLAEFFIWISKHFLSANLIVETHSEYLIRKLQYLIAANEAKENQCVIYNFCNDEDVTRSNNKVREITINSDGQLSDGLAKGFFDEAIKLQFSLRQILNNKN